MVDDSFRLISFVMISVVFVMCVMVSVLFIIMMLNMNVLIVLMFVYIVYVVLSGSWCIVIVSSLKLVSVVMIVNIDGLSFVKLFDDFKLVV